MQPTLGEEESNSLLFRLHLGRQLLDDLLAGGIHSPIEVGEPPDPTEPAFLKWLLVSAWDAIGGTFLELWTANLLDKEAELLRKISGDIGIPPPSPPQ